MRADLHIHTHYSDGKYTPADIAERAERAGVELLSMTDHDSLEGLEEKRAAAERRGLAFVSGWEVSAYEGLSKVHVLGYRCVRNEAYFRFLEERKAGALMRAEDSLKKANTALGLTLTMADVERERAVKTAPLHTMHVVRAFARALFGDAERAGEVYLNYFGAGKPAFSGLCRPTPSEAVHIIHALGGIAVLAHPGRIEQDFSARERLMRSLVGEGLNGLECVYSTHGREETEYFAAFAKENGLLVTGGSDFHAEGRFEIGIPYFEPSEELLQALLQ